MPRAKEQMISEEVAGKSINICHIISNPDQRVTQKLAIDVSPLAIISVSPGETAIVVADYLSKVAEVEVIFIDRYLGTVLVIGETSALETACKGILHLLGEKMAFGETQLTWS